MIWYLTSPNKLPKFHFLSLGTWKNGLPLECRPLGGVRGGLSALLYLGVCSWNLYHHSKHAPVLCLESEGASRTLGLEIVILQWHLGRPLVDPEGATEAGRLCGESGRGGSLAGGTRNSRGHLQGYKQSALHTTACPSSLSAVAPALLCTHMLCKVPGATWLISPEKTVLGIHPYQVLLVPRCFRERADMPLDTLGKGLALRRFTPSHLPKCAAASSMGGSKGRAMLLVHSRQGFWKILHCLAPSFASVAFFHATASDIFTSYF